MTPTQIETNSKMQFLLPFCSWLLYIPIDLKQRLPTKKIPKFFLTTNADEILRNSLRQKPRHRNGLFARGQQTYDHRSSLKALQNESPHQSRCISNCCSHCTSDLCTLADRSAICWDFRMRAVIGQS